MSSRITWDPEGFSFNSRDSWLVQERLNFNLKVGLAGALIPLPLIDQMVTVVDLELECPRDAEVLCFFRRLAHRRHLTSEQVKRAIRAFSLVNSSIKLGVVPGNYLDPSELGLAQLCAEQAFRALDNYHDPLKPAIVWLTS